MKFLLFLIEEPSCFRENGDDLFPLSSFCLQQTSKEVLDDRMTKSAEQTEAWCNGAVLLPAAAMDFGSGHEINSDKTSRRAHGFVFAQATFELATVTEGLSSWFSNTCIRKLYFEVNAERLNQINRFPGQCKRYKCNSLYISQIHVCKCHSLGLDSSLPP